MLARTVKDSLDAPPSTVDEGDCFRITVAASGEWIGHEDELAIFLGGAWHFVAPQTGLSVFDENAGALLHFNAGWHAPAQPLQATGGTTIDSEARQMLADLIEALQKSGIFANSA